MVAEADTEPEAAEDSTEEPEPDYTGTPADEDALRAFLNHFDVCG